MEIFFIILFSVIVAATVLYLVKTYHWFTIQILRPPKPIMYLDLGWVSMQRLHEAAHNMRNEISLAELRSEYHVILGNGNMKVEVLNGKQVEIKDYENREEDNSSR